VALRLIQAPWTQQPQEAVRAASCYQTTALFSGDMQFDAVSGLLVPPTFTSGTRSLAVSEYGLGISTFGANSTKLARRALGNDGWTVVIAATAPASNISSVVAQVGSRGVVRVGFCFDRSEVEYKDASLAVMLLETGVQRSGARAIGVVTNSASGYVVRHTRGQTPRMWVDGKEVAVTNPNSDSFLANPTADGDELRVVGDNTNSTYAFPGTANLAGVIGGVVDAAACAALSANPWQLFEPRRIWVPVAAGGGGSWSVSLTETASANDSLGAATTALVSLIESASAADIITAATIAAVALTEAASASDTQTASYSVTGSGSVTESASATDTLDAATTMLRALTETASAVDTPAASYSVTGSGSVTESASASDALTAANTMLLSLTETASADDQLAAATTMLRAISESASAVDTPAASYSGAGTATIEELTSATDALTAAATLLVTILEAGNADDALQAATTMVRAITEQATAIDTVAGALPGSTWDVSIEELAAAVDLIAGYAAGGLTVSPLGLRLSAGGRSARLSTTARMPRLSTRTR